MIPSKMLKPRFKIKKVRDKLNGVPSSHARDVFFKIQIAMHFRSFSYECNPFGFIMAFWEGFKFLI